MPVSHCSSACQVGDAIDRMADATDKIAEDWKRILTLEKHFTQFNEEGKDTSQIYSGTHDNFI